MQTVHEVSRRTGVSIRALHHYDAIGLLKPTAVTEAGYRLYDEAALERLQTILLFRELNMPLSDIAAILQNPHFDKALALRQQIKLLELQRQRLDALLAFAQNLLKGETQMDFSAFDTETIDRYKAEAKAAWGDTDAYRAYEEKAKTRPEREARTLEQGLMAFFVTLGEKRSHSPMDPAVLETVGQLQAYIDANFYPCTDDMLRSLGAMYADGGAFTENIDHAGGAGTGAFAKAAIDAYCAG